MVNAAAARNANRVVRLAALRSGVDIGKPFIKAPRCKLAIETRRVYQTTLTRTCLRQPARKLLLPIANSPFSNF